MQRCQSRRQTLDPRTGVPRSFCSNACASSKTLQTSPGTVGGTSVSKTRVPAPPMCIVSEPVPRAVGKLLMDILPQSIARKDRDGKTVPLCNRIAGLGVQTLQSVGDPWMRTHRLLAIPSKLQNPRLRKVHRKQLRVKVPHTIRELQPPKMLGTAPHSRPIATVSSRPARPAGETTGVPPTGPVLRVHSVGLRGVYPPCSSIDTATLPSTVVSVPKHTRSTFLAPSFRLVGLY